MPAEIVARPGDAISLEGCIAALDEKGFDPGDRASLAHAANMLARLARNRDFLGDMAIDELKTRCRRQSQINAYSAQVLMLCAARAEFALRANFWPSQDEPVVRNSGVGSFFYGLPHDHNFDFLTIGYHGPGYVSDYYEYERCRVTGLVGESVAIKFVETSQLAPGRLLHYRAGRDIHCQHPPQSFSVSLNIVHIAPHQKWTDQFRFAIDPSRETGSIDGLLSQNADALVVRLALAMGRGNACDLADQLARSHDCDRMRWTCIDALGETITDMAARQDHFARWRDDPSRLVRTLCRQRLDGLTVSDRRNCEPG